MLYSGVTQIRRNKCLVPPVTPGIPSFMLNRISTYRSLFLVFIIIFAVISAACNRGEKLPDKNSAEYRDAVRAFYVGLAALQAGADARAEERLTEVTKLAPGEPAPWANLGLLALRQKEFD